MSGIMQMLLGASGGAHKTYATWNPSDKNSTVILSAGNLQINITSGQASAHTTVSKSTEKWYFELHIDTAPVYTMIGIQAGALDQNGSGITVMIYNGIIYRNGQPVQSGVGSFVQYDIIGVAFDLDTGTVQFYRNNAVYGNQVTGITAGTYFGFVSMYMDSEQSTANFGATPFIYTPPTGFNAGFYQ